MSRSTAKSLLQSAAETQWNQDGVETLSFEDPHDINAGGTAYLYGDSGVVRLELSLPAERAAQVIEYVRSGRLAFSVEAARIPIESVYSDQDVYTDQCELAALIAEQAQDAAE